MTFGVGPRLTGGKFNGYGTLSVVGVGTTVFLYVKKVLTRSHTPNSYHTKKPGAVAAGFLTFPSRIGIRHSKRIKLKICESAQHYIRQVKYISGTNICTVISRFGPVTHYITFLNLSLRATQRSYPLTESNRGRLRYFQTE